MKTKNGEELERENGEEWREGGQEEQEGEVKTNIREELQRGIEGRGQKR